jgi:hypothetical protein
VSERPGDLGLKVEPIATSPQSLPAIRDARARLVSDNDVWNNGRRMEWACETAPPTSCLVLGDSFADALLPFLAESFGRLVFGHIFTLDHELVLAESPRVVVSVLNERFLRRVPNDLAARSLREWEREKLEQGKTMTARRALRRELFPA